MFFPLVSNGLTFSMGFYSKGYFTAILRKDDGTNDQALICLKKASKKLNALAYYSRSANCKKERVK